MRALRGVGFAVRVAIRVTAIRVTIRVSFACCGGGVGDGGEGPATPARTRRAGHAMVCGMVRSLDPSLRVRVAAGAAAGALPAETRATSESMSGP